MPAGGGSAAGRAGHLRGHSLPRPALRMLRDAARRIVFCHFRELHHQGRCQEECGKDWPHELGKLVENCLFHFFCICFVSHFQIFNEHPSRKITSEVITKLVKDARTSLQVDFTDLNQVLVTAMGVHRQIRKSQNVLQVVKVYATMF